MRKVTKIARRRRVAHPCRFRLGITIGANGNPWYAESLTDTVATLKLR